MYNKKIKTGTKYIIFIFWLCHQFYQKLGRDGFLVSTPLMVVVRHYDSKNKQNRNTATRYIIIITGPSAFVKDFNDFNPPNRANKTPTSNQAFIARIANRCPSNLYQKYNRKRSRLTGNNARYEFCAAFNIRYSPGKVHIVTVSC